MLLATIATVLTVAALQAVRPVAMPLAFAILLAILVNPLRTWLNKRLPQWLSLMIVLAAIIAVLGIFGSALLLSAEQLEPRLPDYAERLQQLWQTLSAQMETWGISVEASSLQSSSAWQSVLGRAIGRSQAILGNLSLFVLIISLLALLLEIDEYRDRTQTAFSSSTSAR